MLLQTVFCLSETKSFASECKLTMINHIKLFFNTLTGCLSMEPQTNTKSDQYNWFLQENKKE